MRHLENLESFENQKDKELHKERKNTFKNLFTDFVDKRKATDVVPEEPARGNESKIFDRPCDPRCFCTQCRCNCVGGPYCNCSGGNCG